MGIDERAELSGRVACAFRDLRQFIFKIIGQFPDTHDERHQQTPRAGIQSFAIDPAA